MVQDPFSPVCQTNSIVFLVGPEWKMVGYGRGNRDVGCEPAILATLPGQGTGYRVLAGTAQPPITASSRLPAISLHPYGPLT